MDPARLNQVLIRDRGLTVNDMLCRPAHLRYLTLKKMQDQGIITSSVMIDHHI